MFFEVICMKDSAIISDYRKITRKSEIENAKRFYDNGKT